jgi:antitoxin component of MazEF toxin-antitoxin module
MIDDLTKIRKITITGGGTYSLTLPKGAVQNLGWKKGQRVVVERKGETLVIRDFVPAKDAR